MTSGKPKSPYNPSSLTQEHREWLTDLYISGEYKSGLDAWEKLGREFEDAPADPASTTRWIKENLEYKDLSGAWSLIDSEFDVQGNAICIDVLAEVVLQTRGKRDHITIAEANLIVTLHQLKPKFGFWPLYKWAANYVRLDVLGQSTLEQDMWLASLLDTPMLSSYPQHWDRAAELVTERNRDDWIRNGLPDHIEDPSALPPRLVRDEILQDLNIIPKRTEQTVLMNSANDVVKEVDVRREEERKKVKESKGNNNG
tara:strand:- start:1615 stop:2382 length:768 start_codon:yes stop_codon:yes gene_type:complete